MLRPFLCLDHFYNWHFHIKDGVISNWACSEQLATLLKTRHNRELRWECVLFQLDEPCPNHKNTSYIFTVLYLILTFFYEILTYIFIYLLPQVWNEIIADNQHNLGKFEWVKVHSHEDQWRGIVMFTHSLLWMRQL